MPEERLVNLDFGDLSPDKEDRMQDFWSRHGGPSGEPLRHAEDECGTRGWSEAYARDGYTLRCDWSRVGDKEEMQFVERRQHAP